MASPRSSLGALARGVVYVALAFFCIFIALVAVYSFAPPVSTLMVGRVVIGKSYQRVYTPLKDIAPVVAASVIASEDGGFCRNAGVDWGALHEVLRKASKNGPKRGASTITMQTAKNLFLWPGRSDIRKGIEIGMALVLGQAWSKSRTLEIYLNIAEWGDGIYGVEAAAQRYFHKKARELTANEAALLVTSLPNPIKRDPAHPVGFQRRLAAAVAERARDEDLTSCLGR
jgi:monofunctional biosynthetic peptidoglycan transglycosylase